MKYYIRQFFYYLMLTRKYKMIGFFNNSIRNNSSLTHTQTPRPHTRPAGERSPRSNLRPR